MIRAGVAQPSHAPSGAIPCSHPSSCRRSGRSLTKSSRCSGGRPITAPPSWTPIGRCRSVGCSAMSRDQQLRWLLPTEPKLDVCFIAGAQHVCRSEAEHPQHRLQLGGTERFLTVVAVAIENPVAVQQGHGLAAGRSGASTNQLQHSHPPQDSTRLDNGGECKKRGDLRPISARSTPRAGILSHGARAPQGDARRPESLPGWRGCFCPRSWRVGECGCRRWRRGAGCER